MKKEEFIKKFEYYISEGFDVSVGVEVPNNACLEQICNKNIDLQNKLAFYLKTYDDDMVHKHAKGVSIKEVRWLL